MGAIPKKLMLDVTQIKVQSWTISGNKYVIAYNHQGHLELVSHWTNLSTLEHE